MVTRRAGFRRAMFSPLRHRRMRSAVELYLDGELHAEARSEVARHLSICWSCSTLAETLRLMKQSLSQCRRRNSVSLSERRLRRFAEKLDGEPANMRPLTATVAKVPPENTGRKIR